MIVVPAIFASDPKEFGNLLYTCDGVVNRVQIDVNDGTFLGERSFLPEVMPALESNLFFDFHLMVKEPIHWLERCARLGADRVFGHVEQIENQNNFVEECQIKGLKIGFAVDIKTPVRLIDPLVAGDLDAVLLMGYPAGRGGQKFDQSVFEKIKDLVDLRRQDKSPFAICVDGGVWEDNIAKLFSLGVDEVVIGRRLFHGDLGSNIETLLSRIK